MSTPTLLPLPPLQETLYLLDSLYRRNKNQHRHQKWWKWLNLFRRNVRIIVEFREKEEERRRELVRGLRRAGIGAGGEEEERRVEGVLRWMNDVGVEKCWVAFTDLISDTQFSSLGVVLVAILARFANVIGFQPTMERNSQSAIRHTGLASSVPSPEEALDKGSGMADVGEVVERMEHAGEATRISTESKRMVLHEPRIRHREERSKPTRGALITGDESSEKSRPKKRLRQEAEFPESRNHTKTIKPESIEPTKVLEKDNAFLKRDDVALRRSAAGTSKERLAGAEPNVKKKDREKAKDKKSKKRKKGDVIDDLFAGLD